MGADLASGLGACYPMSCEKSPRIEADVSRRVTAQRVPQTFAQCRPERDRARIRALDTPEVIL